MTEQKDPSAWNEDDSRHFIEYGEYFVPERELQIDIVCSVIPPVPKGGVIVDVCSGAGLLAQALAERFPEAFIHALDGSQIMLDSTASKLTAVGVAHATAQIELAEREWRTFDMAVHAFVSSLAVHHLNGPGKARLFKDLAAALAPGGVVVICDLIEPCTPENLELWERHWDDGVRERSLQLDGDAKMLDFFRKDGWNYYSDPDADPIDQPSTLMEQLTWMADAGLNKIDVHWLRAGHAIFSGRKPTP